MSGKDADEMPEGIIIPFNTIRYLKELKNVDPVLERKWLREMRERIRKVQQQMNGGEDGNT